jgi:hypothetical protein
VEYDVLYPGVGKMRSGKLWLVFFANKCSAEGGDDGLAGAREHIYIYTLRYEHRD